MNNKHILAYTCHRCRRQVSYTSAITVQSGARYYLCDKCLEDFFYFMSGEAIDTQDKSNEEE